MSRITKRKMERNRNLNVKPILDEGKKIYCTMVFCNEIYFSRQFIVSIMKKTKYIPFQRNLLHLTMALKLGWRKNSTYTFPDPGYLGTSIAIQIKSDDTKPNMVDTKLMCRISNKYKHCIL